MDGQNIERAIFLRCFVGAAARTLVYPDCSSSNVRSLHCLSSQVII